MFRTPTGNRWAGRCWHTCYRNAGGYHCVCQDRSGNVSYLKNCTLSAIGYATSPIILRPSGLGMAALNVTPLTPFDYNANARKLYYYDAELEEIR